MANPIYKVILKHTESLTTAELVADKDGFYSKQLELGQPAVVSTAGSEGIVIKNTDGKLVEVGNTSKGTAITAGNGIGVESLDEGKTSRISAKAKQNDNILTVGTAGIQTTIAMKRDGNNLTITGVNGATVATIDLTDLIISGVLTDAQVKVDPAGHPQGTYLYLKWKITAQDGSTSEKETYIDVTKLIPVFTAGSCIDITDNTNGSKAISLKLTGNDKVLEGTGTGLSAIVDLVYDKGTQLIKLLGKAGVDTPIATIDASNFALSGTTIKDAELVEQDGQGNKGTFIKLVWSTTSGDKEMYINVTSLITLYKAGDGLQLDDTAKTFSVNLDPTSEEYLTVGANGLKLSGIKDAIKNTTTSIVNVNPDDKILSNPAQGLSATVWSEYKSDEQKIYLYGKNGANNQPEILSTIDASQFVIDGLLKEAQLVEQDGQGNKGHYLHLVWNLEGDKTSEMYVDVSDLVKQFTEGAGIKFTKNNTTGSTEIALNIAANDQYLKSDASGLRAVVSAKYDGDKQQIQLIGKDSQVTSVIDASDFIISELITDVNVVTENNVKYLVITWNLKDGSTKQIKIPFTDLVKVYTASHGVKLEGLDFQGVVNTQEDEGFLSVDEGGFKVTGVNDAIKAAIDKSKGDSVTNITDGLGTKAINASDSTKVDLNVDFKHISKSDKDEAQLQLVDKNSQSIISNIKLDECVKLVNGSGLVVDSSSTSDKLKLNLPHMIFDVGQDNSKKTYAVLKTYSDGIIQVPDESSWHTDNLILVSSSESDWLTYDLFTGFAIGKKIKDAVNNLSFYQGHNDVTTISNIPIDRHLVIANVVGDGQAEKLSFKADIPDGRDIHIIIHNTDLNHSFIVDFSDITADNTFINVQNMNLSIDKSSYAEINVISAGTTKYIRFAANNQ